jgi:hypothetical protein
LKLSVFSLQAEGGSSNSVVVTLKRRGRMKKGVGLKGVSEKALHEADIFKRVHQLKVIYL